MRAAYYEKNGPAREVLHVGDMENCEPGRGEVRVRLRTSGSILPTSKAAPASAARSHFRA